MVLLANTNPLRLPAFALRHSNGAFEYLELDARPRQVLNLKGVLAGDDRARAVGVGHLKSRNSFVRVTATKEKSPNRRTH